LFQKKVLTIVITCLGLLGTSVLPSRATELGDAVQQQKDISNQKNQAQGKLNELTYTEDKIKARMVQLENANRRSSDAF